MATSLDTWSTALPDTAAEPMTPDLLGDLIRSIEERGQGYEPSCPCSRRIGL